MAGPQFCAAVEGMVAVGQTGARHPWISVCATVSEERGAVCSLVLLAELTVQNSRADPQSHTREYAGPTPKVILEKMARARIVSFI